MACFYTATLAWNPTGVDSIDICTVGLGNIGTTNVLRTGNKGLAAATLLLDAGKGATAVLLARRFGGEAAGMLAGVAAFIGHCFPVWLNFRGGKGVATLLGVALAAVPLSPQGLPPRRHPLR